MQVTPTIRSIRNRLRRSAKATSLCLFAARRLLIVCLAQAFANTLAVHRSSFSQRIGSALLALRNSSNSMSSLCPKFCGGALSWSPGVRCANNVSIVPNTLLHNPMNHQPRPRLTVPSLQRAKRNVLIIRTVQGEAMVKKAVAPGGRWKMNGRSSIIGVLHFGP
jgi:hypothetical protein